MAGLYIHIPFCGSRCAYCDFYSSVGVERSGQFVDALCGEMTARSSLSTFNFQLSTIYFGGGTPSMLPPESLHRILRHAASLWDSSAVEEVTLEANPEDLTMEFLQEIRNYGATERSEQKLSSQQSEATRDLPYIPVEYPNFNRLSVGIQSFDDELLRMMGRRHSSARAIEAIGEAQRAGFDNISIDLIYGIPRMTDQQWQRSLDRAVALGVQHISAYHLTIEPGTPFGRSGLQPVAEADSERQFAMLRRTLSEAGFEHYEISNFALPNRRARHNSAYWRGESYLGVGPSAHSFDGHRRREWVGADLRQYLASPQYEGETLTDAEIRNERIMVGLRTAEGIDESLVVNDNLRNRFLAEGLLVRRGVNLAIPPERWLLADYVIGALFE